MSDTLVFTDDATALNSADVFMLLGRKSRLASPDIRELVPATVSDAVFDQLYEVADGGDSGRYSASYTGAAPRRIVLGVLPEACSRHNAPSRAWAIPGLVKSAGRGNLAIVAAVDDVAHASAVACAIARALPTFSATSRSPRGRTVTVFMRSATDIVTDLAPLRAASAGVRRAAHWVDMPPDRLTPDAWVDEAKAVASRLPGVTCSVIRGDALLENGLNALHAVGKAAVCPPALVVLDHAPLGATRKVAWVGKGIVYDTGGLSLKTKTGMPGMKNDMGGSAAVLAAFEAAVQQEPSVHLTAVLCIAENAIGPSALRPDDIITAFSGRTIEINNTDAEGRLVLADGLAWVAKHRQPDEIVDLATLTGAQATATGQDMAALYANNEELEQRAVTAGRRVGDLCHPLPYVPEFFRGEFRSAVADMRNSVKRRNNAQSSCAGQFLAEHLRAYKGPWLHIDMAAPSVSGGRGTGYGVALLLGLIDLA